MDKANSKIAEKLLKWYQKNARKMPWRVPPQINNQPLPDPYHILLSEMMLQQTQTSTVHAYFERFIKNWPKLEDLAKADIDKILHAWAGLGYYRRAHNLHKCAKLILEKHNGQLPSELSTLRALPGIGPYTASAIRAIAFNKKAHVIDGNIERIFTRLVAYPKNFPQNIKEREAFSEIFIPQDHYGNYAQALMDLGATICTPKKPQCHRCPIAEECKAFAQGTQELFPIKKKKKKIPTKYGYLYWHENKKGEVLIEKRPTDQMLGGLYGFPTSEWSAKIKIDTPHIKHTFSHFHLHLEIKFQKKPPIKCKDSFYVNIEKLDEYGFPSLMKKAIAKRKKLIHI